MHKQCQLIKRQVLAELTITAMQ